MSLPRRPVHNRDLATQDHKVDVGECRDDETTDHPRVVALAFMFGLSACTNPYDPVQRFIGGASSVPVAELQLGLPPSMGMVLR